MAVPDPDFYLGLNYGLMGNDLPSPETVVSLYKKHNIDHMRIFQPDPAVLDALRGSYIDVVIGTFNHDIPVLAQSQSSAQSWFSSNIQRYLDDVSISFISVGNEVIPGEFAPYVLPAMENLQAVIAAAGLMIKVTTVIHNVVLKNTYPPSSSEFESPEMVGIVRFLQAHSSQLLANVYPYYGYDPKHVSLDYVMFTATSPVVRDGDLVYYNMFDAIVDAFYWAMEKAGVSDVGVVVSETGWPHKGNKVATLKLASTYNKNLVKHLRSARGTPKRPNDPLLGYIFAAFDENEKPKGVERSWGVFRPDGKPNYDPFLSDFMC